MADDHAPSPGDELTDAPTDASTDVLDEVRRVPADLEVSGWDDPELVDRLETLVGALVEEVPLDDLLDQVVHLAARAVPASAASSVTVLDERDQLRTVVASEADAAAVDRLQSALHEGPCLDAIRLGVEQRCEDLTDDPRWPRFSARATDLGFGAVLALPLQASGTTFGALNLFLREPHGFSDDDRAAARRLAGPAAAALANARAYHRAELLRSQLAEAVRSRAVIEQAKGIVMATRGCDADEAFAVLRSLSQHTNRKLRTIAEALVARSGEAAVSGR